MHSLRRLSVRIAEEPESHGQPEKTPELRNDQGLFDQGGNDRATDAIVGVHGENADDGGFRFRRLAVAEQNEGQTLERGECVAGPCKGQSLREIPATVIDGDVRIRYAP